MSYSMGQYLYNFNHLNSYKTEILQTISGEKLSSANFRDLKITPTTINGERFTTFNYGTSYLLDLKIPRNTTYDLQIDLKLMNETIDSNNKSNLKTNQYQEIKRIYVPKADQSQTVSTVVLYESEEVNEEMKPVVHSGILRELKEDCGTYDVYDETPTAENPTYSYKKPDNGFSELGNKRLVELAHTWEQRDENTYRHFPIIFSPKTDAGDFNRIILELVRNTYDNDITFTVNNSNASDNGTSYTGIHIDEGNENFTVTLYTINNLLGEQILPSKLSHLSVWSHQDLMMAINGEEIKVGPSGYYELNDFEITSLGIACMDSNDKFTIDYQYET